MNSQNEDESQNPGKFLLNLISEGKEKSKNFVGKGKILVAGKTGVGKSSLINSVFGNETCKTGSGKPITQQIEEFTTSDSLITLIDSKGLELVDYDRIRAELITYIEEKNGSTNPFDHVNLCWLCIDYQGRRVEDAEIELVKKLAEINVKSIIVLTKYYYPHDKNFEAEVNKVFGSIGIKINSIPVVDDDGVEILKLQGLDLLIDKTNVMLPEAQRIAFIAAQKVDKTIKAGAAKKVIHAASMAAASAAGLNPLPIPDATFIIPIQIGMMISINKVFNISNDDIKSLLAPVLGPLALGYAGPQIAAFCAKFVPGIGTIAGGIVNAGIAATLTETAGALYLRAVTELYETTPVSHIHMSDIADKFKSLIASQK
ncbi:YcjF family protein [Acidithiobacillus sp.]|uniref:YcjF family protein n=1 Tax=Acidithiobacillus sp. TaxID=1872118 RepID=UPI003565BCC2